MKRLACLLSALAIAVMATACSSGGSSRSIVAEFADVGDLVPRANVQQSDAVIGRVRSISLISKDGQWLARVALALDPATKVTASTRAIVRSTSLLGEKYVDLVTPNDSAPDLPNDSIITTAYTRKAPELEAVFSQLGAILQSGGLEDLAKITSASAMILEGQTDDVGRVLDGTAKLIASIRAQKDALASGLADLNSAAKTLRARKGTLDHALSVSDGALRIVASQSSELDALIVQLDRLGKPLAALTRAHKGDINQQVRDLNTIVPRLYQVRSTLEAAIKKLPSFTKLFARSAPGDYFQLDVFAAAVPIGTPASAQSLSTLFLEAAK